MSGPHPEETFLTVIQKLNAWLALTLALPLACGWAAWQLQAPAYAGASPAAVDAALWRTAAVFGAAFLVVAVLGIWLRLSVRSGILRSLRAASHFIDKVAEGDLTAHVDARGSGGMQKMLEGLERMGGDLRALVSEVQAVARRVTDSSAQIAQGNLDLSQRTEEQATTLEETASSMEELTSTVASNADNAREASRLATGASSIAQKGGDVVGQVVATMGEISAASRRIGDITGVIDGIAFQTNILALNAAVEAARAGDQGRGFAVVAGEVRELAQRSASAAREIKTLIAQSSGRVEAGERLVNGAGETMREIVVSVGKVSALVAEIAQACQEQSAGIGQVNGAITQMEQVVQQNASLVEEASAATECMKDDAAALFALVSRFRLEAAAAGDLLDAAPRFGAAPRAVPERLLQAVPPSSHLLR